LRIAHFERCCPDVARHAAQNGNGHHLAAKPVPFNPVRKLSRCDQ